jgi:hypothetical protein
MSDVAVHPAGTHVVARPSKPLHTPRSRYWKDFIKLCWTNAGASLPDAALDKARVWLDYLYTARWLKTHDLWPKSRVQGGREVFRAVAERVADQPSVYLEFGVHKGHSMSQWSVLLRHPNSQLVGFDSFVGLPEQWRGLPSGGLTVSGLIPQIADPRISFEKGWFQDTLPKFKVIDREALVVFLDADLYSSTILVLRTLKEHMQIGRTYLIFGQFTDRDHELRAFEDFVRETGMKFETAVADYNLYYPAFKRVA